MYNKNKTLARSKLFLLLNPSKPPKLPLNATIAVLPKMLFLPSELRVFALEKWPKKIKESCEANFEHFLIQIEQFSPVVL